MNKPLDIVIVGGGTAGWMAASALVGALKPGIVAVRLVESDEIATVGVGEATLPQMKEFNDYVGIIEPDMMRATNGTFKLGIEFRDWGFKGSSYVHPFGAHGKSMHGAAFHHHWLRTRQAGHDVDIEKSSYAIVAARGNRFEFPAEDASAINATYAYAYHFDASLYARYLRGFAEARGLRRIEGRIVDVTRDGLSGDIASVTLASGEVVAGDFFIDCSGFRSLLMGQTLGVGFEEWGQWLPCDRALAVPCARSEDFSPYTRSTAREAGWQWRIPLQHRTGNGYVYSSNFIGDDEAASVLMANLDGEALGEPRPIRFKSGRRTTSWQNNCIGVGLASGFLEPLESTSIYLIQIAITNLIRLFPDRQIEPRLRDEFNRLVDVEYERVRDFLILHYHLNARTDAEIWRHCREMEVPDSLKARMEMFAHRGHIDAYKDGLFAPPSWLSVYLGQGLAPNAYDRLADNLTLDDTLQRIERDQAAIARRVEAMPQHADFVADYCGSIDARAAGEAA